MSLPQRLTLLQMQQQWASTLNPILQVPIVNGRLLTRISLVIGSNVISHGLSRELQGWLLTGVDGASTIYDNQDTNPTPNRTLSLTSSAAVTVSIWVF